MAKVHVCNVLVLDNPAQFMSKLEFEITFECIEDLPEDLEWKIIYVGSAESEEFDQVLDTVYVGPVPEGRHKFVFTADPPNPEKIPTTDVVGVTVILITCAYRSQEFIRVGYYVSNEYDDDEMKETPPETPVFDHLTRNILASNPRVTKFKINWDNPNSQPSTSTGNGESSEQQNTMEDESESSSDEEFDENKPPKNPSGNPNALPPFKDPMLVSPMKSGLPPRLPSFTTENTNNSTNDGMDIE
jgi:histone chaperone ASF1